MDLIRKWLAPIGVLLLTVSTAWGFNQSRYDRELGQYRTCAAFESLIDVSTKNPSRPPTPEEKARQAQVIALFQDTLRARGVPIVKCESLKPERWPF